MLNHYPLWKYIMLVIVLVIGLLYALPSFYNKDPIIQIVGVWDSNTHESLVIQIKNTLKQQKIISKSITVKNNTILATFSNLDAQRRAFDALTNVLDKNYIINLIPVTPSWLIKIGANPIKLGLDLQGGIHIIMEVDTNTVLTKLQERIISTMQIDLHKHGILPYSIVRKIENYGIEIYFTDTVHCNKAMIWLKTEYRDLVITKMDDNTLRFTLKNNQLCAVSSSIVQQNIAILRNRINQLGVVEPLVQRQGSDRIVIELPGILDTRRVKKILEATATIEFRLVNSYVDQIDIDNHRVPVDSEVKFTKDGQKFVLYKQVILTGNHITDSAYSVDEYNNPQVNIFLDRSGGTTMSNFTKNNIGKLMATLFVEYKDSGQRDINDHVVFTKHEEIINIATIQSRISNNFRITGINNPNDARQLSILLCAGTLIAPIHILEERTIGPTLGMKNIIQGLKACILSLLVSILFMIVWYRKFGLIATTAIIANLILIISIMSLLPGVALTMPGIAGIVLMLAVTVDANVLINERIKEELRNGRSVQQAIHEGYRGAFSSIIDANITTLITAIVLYAIGTASIKNFAITTVIGVVTSMFTTITGTRAIVNLLYGGKHIDKLSI